jgi:hypothetical protein
MTTPQGGYPGGPQDPWQSDAFPPPADAGRGWPPPAGHPAPGQQVYRQQHDPAGPSAGSSRSAHAGPAGPGPAGLPGWPAQGADPRSAPGQWERPAPYGERGWAGEQGWSGEQGWAAERGWSAERVRSGGQGRYGEPGPVAAPPGSPPGPGRRGRVPLIVLLFVVLAVVLIATGWALNRGGTDPGAQAQRFMTAVQTGDFGTARALLCKDGRDKFGGAAQLREELAGAGQIAGFTLGTVSDSVYQGDKRKEIAVSVRMADGTTRHVTLSMTRESGRYLICGF